MQLIRIEKNFELSMSSILEVSTSEEEYPPSNDFINLLSPSSPKIILSLKGDIDKKVNCKEESFRKVYPPSKQQKR